MSRVEDRVSGGTDVSQPPLFVLQMPYVGLYLGAGAVFFALAGLATACLRIGYIHTSVYGILNVFDLNSDSSIPTWFSSFGLAVCAGLLMIVTRLESLDGSRLTRHWRLLSIIFLVLSVDETARLHETIGAALGAQVVQNVGQLDGVFHFNWIPFGIASVVILGLYYLPFLYKLPAGLRYRIMAAAIVYVGGALVTEIFNSVTEFSEGTTASARYQYWTVFEEFCEMAGVALFGHVLAGYIKDRVRGADLLLGLATRSRPEWQPRSNAIE